MKIFAVRIGERYGPEYEKYLEAKLPEYDFHWIRAHAERHTDAVEQDVCDEHGH